MSEVWHARLSSTTVNGLLRIHLPTPISAALNQRGYTHVAITLVDEGLLMRPYITSDENKKKPAPVSLPDWDHA